MSMKRIEADTLEEAYSKAAKALSCSVTEISYEIIQYPTTGVMGLFKKSAIIIAAKKSAISTVEENQGVEVGESKEIKESIEDIQEERNEIVQEVKEVKEESLDEKSLKKADTIVEKKNEVVDTFFAEEKEETPAEVLYDDDRDTPENKALSLEIEKKIQHLMKVACFEIDTVEVDVFNGIAHIFIDGEDAALLIGKEGYRYNALSYMLFNWINARYDLYIKLEIAEFIQAQEEMIDNYLKPIAEHIIEHGKGKTKPLDGILVQIALEKLRAMFPNKYIAIKTGKDGKKFIIINNFNTRKSN